jgi:predicted kinase
MLTNKEKPILMIPVGLPGSGKTTYYQTVHTYTRISKDVIRFSMLKSKETKIYFDAEIEPLVTDFHWKQFKAAISKKENIYLDNTNLTIEKRRPYIRLAKEKDYFVAAVHFHISMDLILQQNEQRAEVVSPQIIGKMDQALNWPLRCEGFDMILTIRRWLK